MKKFDPKQLGKAPAGYIPGVSRGTNGFMTRSDIGPMMTDVSMGLNMTRNQTQTQQALRGHADLQQRDANINDSKFDDWSGFSSGNLFQIMDYDDEDREADEIYASVDMYLEGKRAAKIEQSNLKIQQEIQKNNPDPKAEMKDVIKELGTLKYDDWMALPDIGDYKYRRNKRAEKFTPIPDSLIADRLEKEKTGAYAEIDSRAPVGMGGISMMPVQSGINSTIPQSLSQLGQVRGTVLSLNLDNATKGTTTSQAVNKTGYLTALSKLPINTDEDISDLKKARVLMKSIINSDPKNPKGWVAAARVEELDGKLAIARQILANAVDQCPTSEDIWYEAARLEKPDKAKEILTKGIISCPKSVKLWLAHAKLEKDAQLKKAVLSKALKYVPQSEKVWKELIDCSTNDEEARNYLKDAIVCLPDNLQMRLAYAKLLPYAEAKQVLNDANRHFQMAEKSIWINASKLEEAEGNVSNCRLIISKALNKILKKKKIIKREEWIYDAQECEKAGQIETCKAILHAVMTLDMKDGEHEQLWIEDSSLCVQRGHIQTARWIHNYSVELEPHNAKYWLEALEFERMHGEESAYLRHLDDAIKNNSENQQFYLKAARTYLKKNDLQSARSILAKAVINNPLNPALYIAQSQIEKEAKQFDTARGILKNSRESLEDAELWRKSIRLELELGHSKASLDLALEAFKTKKFRSNPDILCDLGEVYEQLGQLNEARSVYGGIVNSDSHKTCERAWIALLRVVEKLLGIQKARTVLEKAKLAIPNLTEELWYEKIMLEERAGNEVIPFIEEALKIYPKSGLIWTLSIHNEIFSKRKAKALTALEKCEHSVHVINAIALVYWITKFQEKASFWFERSLKIDPKNGDTYAFLLNLARETDNKTLENDIISRCVEAEPSHGRLWNKHACLPVNWDLPIPQLLERVVDDARKYRSKL